MSDIVERLRARATDYRTDLHPQSLLFSELWEAADEIKRLRAIRVRAIRGATIEECKVTICDVFASTSPRDYMMNGSEGILKRMIDALHALKERQT